MTRKPGVRHSRVGPCMDVAMCGERGGQLVFSASHGGVTCGVCKARSRAAFEGPRNQLEMAARRAYFRAGGI